MGNAKYRTVDFDAELDGTGKVKFDGINQVNVRNDNQGDYHFITFALDDDETGLDLRFRPMSANPNDRPFWIQPIALGCPSSAATMDNVVEPLFVSPSGKELTVINYNANIEEMRFALRLVDRNGAGHDYDPIMNNQNGRGSFGWASVATIAAVAASAGALLYVGLRGGVD